MRFHLSIHFAAVLVLSQHSIKNCQFFFQSPNRSHAQFYSRIVDKLILSLNPVHLRGGVIVVFKKGNAVLCRFNFIEFILRNRSSLVNESKTGVLANLKLGNLTSMRDWRPFTQSFHKNHPCTSKCHSTGSSQIMMNISEHGNFSNSVRLCLGDLSSTIPCIVNPCYVYSLCV